jgi:hypothetical protein
MNEAPTGTSSGTPTQSAGDGELARADAAAVVATGTIIDKWNDMFAMLDVPSESEVRAVLVTGQAALREWVGFETLLSFKASASKPGEGDKDALMYSNLMGVAIKLLRWSAHIASRQGTSTGWMFTNEAQALKDAAYEAHQALIQSEPGPEPGSAEALKTSDEG